MPWFSSNNLSKNLWSMWQHWRLCHWCEQWSLVHNKHNITERKLGVFIVTLKDFDPPKTLTYQIFCPLSGIHYPFLIFHSINWFINPIWPHETTRLSSARPITVKQTFRDFCSKESPQNAPKLDEYLTETVIRPCYAATHSNRLQGIWLQGSLVWMLVKQGCVLLIRLVRTSVTGVLFQSLTSLL